MTRVLILLLGFLALSTAQAAPQRSTPLQKGVYITSWRAGEYRTKANRESLEELADTGAEWVAVLGPNFQMDKGTTEIHSAIDDPYSGQRRVAPSEDDIGEVVRWAHAKGIKVLLASQVMLLDRSQWKGQIGEEFHTEQDWKAWWTSYRAFILRNARLAQRLGIDQLSIGNELRAASHRESDWRALIRDVRAEYKGPLTYAAHHDEVYRIAWWDDLDFIGIDAYWDLVNTDSPTVAQIREAWAPHARRLKELAARFNRRVIFTEVGFRSVNGAARKPWKFGDDMAVDDQEQADAYEATFQAFFHEPWVGGFYWWTWEPDTNPDPRGYTPQGKPAEQVLRKWYGDQPPNDRFAGIYRDDLGRGWTHTAWGSRVDVHAPQGRYDSAALSVSTSDVGGVYLTHKSTDLSRSGSLELYLQADGDVLVDVTLETREGEHRWDPTKHTRGSQGPWMRVVIPLPADLPQGAGPVKLHVNVSGSGQVLLDDVRLVEAGASVDPPAANPFAALLDAIANLFRGLMGTSPSPTPRPAGTDGLVGSLRSR